MGRVAAEGWSASDPIGELKKSRKIKGNPLTKEEMTTLSAEYRHSSKKEFKKDPTPVMSLMQRHGTYPTSLPRDYSAYLYALEPWSGARKSLATTPGKATTWHEP